MSQRHPVRPQNIEDTFVIAEIGKGFIQTEEDKPVEEYLVNAKALIDAAAETGVDAVKFQTHEVEDEQLNIDITSPHFKGSDRYSWVTRNTNATPLSFWQELKQYAEGKGLPFFSTPMSRMAAQKLDKVGVPYWKVGSGDVQDYVMMNYLIRTGKPIMISCGMVSLAELDDIVKYITSHGNDLVLFYCISQYPCPPELFNLGTIALFKEKYPNVTIGFSDHSLGHDAALAAVKVGARVVEKHFSLSRELWGSDHKVSMLPEEMKAMVDAIRSGNLDHVDETPFYGNKEKELEGANNQFRPYFNKSLVVGQDISAGTTLTEDMVFAMRPKKFCDGMDAHFLNDIVGKQVSKDLQKYDALSSDVIA